MADCRYCGFPADGPMLSMGKEMAHVPCVIQTLNELLDPFWEDGYGRAPEEIIGYVIAQDAVKDGKDG